MGAPTPTLLYPVTLTLEDLELEAVFLLVPPPAIGRAEHIRCGGEPQRIFVLHLFSVDDLRQRPGHDDVLPLRGNMGPDVFQNMLGGPGS